MAKFAKSQLGTKNKKNYTRGSSRITQLLNPWGRPVGLRGKGSRGRVGGSSTREATPAAALKGMDYPANKPGEWPVEPDYVNHVKNPTSPSGLNTNTANRHNTAVEQAYHRAGYQ